MIDRLNLSTEHQPKGSARNLSATLDRKVSGDYTEVTPEHPGGKPLDESEDEETEAMEEAQEDAAEKRENEGGYQ